MLDIVSNIRNNITMKQKVNKKLMFNRRVFELHADVCKTLANPKRLEILYALMEGELSVGELVERLNLPKANISQHLAILRQRRVVLSRREGLNIYYRISNPKIMHACRLMREVLMKQIEEGKRLFGMVGKGT